MLNNKLESLRTKKMGKWNLDDDSISAAMIKSADCSKIFLQNSIVKTRAAILGEN
jgi:hypothetical protein